MNDSSAPPAGTGARGRTTIALAIAVLGAAVLAVVAIGDLGGRDGQAGVNPSASIPPSNAVATPTATQPPSDTPSASTGPSLQPSSNGGNDAIPIRIDLVTATRAHVYIDIVDRAGILTGAKSGVPGDGQSVEGQRLVVENLDATTLQLTWVDFPIDNGLALFIDRTETGYRFLLVQPGPTGGTDSIGFDRQLVLTFRQPISAADVDAFLQEGLASG